MRHGFADTRHGQVHYVEHGSGEPVLLLHQTPRSWDEYRDVLPLLGGRFRAIAMDTLGFGASARPAEAWTVELIAVEVAAAAPERVRGLVLSGMPFVDADRRRRVAARPPIDHVVPAADGSHLTRLWANRADFYPPDRPDLLDRLVRDALGVLDRVEEGHLALNRYRMEERIGLVQAPTLALCGELDTFSLPDLPAVVAALPDARSAVLPGTGVPAVDHRPEQFAAAVGEFLAALPAPA